MPEIKPLTGEKITTIRGILAKRKIVINAILGAIGLAIAAALLDEFL